MRAIHMYLLEKIAFLSKIRYTNVVRKMMSEIKKKKIENANVKCECECERSEKKRVLKFKKRKTQENGRE